MQRGAIILCGGGSTRMGRDKATLPFGPELMLQRVVRLVSEAVARDKIVVVAAPGQELPDLPNKVQLARDAHKNRGPLEGLAAGLRTLSDQVEAVYATGCDVPLLRPLFIKRMFSQMDEYDIAVPRDGKFHHPLAAVYRTSVLASVEQLLNADRLRPFFLFQEVRTREVPIDQLRAVDPELSSLANCNDEQAYRRALQQAGAEETTNLTNLHE